MQDKINKKLGITESGTYKKLLRIIVEDSMALLPTNVYEVFNSDYDIFINLKYKLIDMRAEGTTYLAYNPSNKRFYKDVEVQQYDNNNFIFLVNNQEINSKYILVIGDREDIELAKFSLSQAEQQDILAYENMLEQLDSDYKNSYKDYIKTTEPLSMHDTDRKGFAKKMQDILTRKKNHIIRIDREDELATLKRDIQDIRWLLEERKSKICLNHSIPYTRLFGDTANGMQATGEGDRRNWNMNVRFFQLQYIFPVLLQFAKMVGREKEFRELQIEPIETSDKLLEAQIRDTYLTTLENSYMSGAIDLNTLSELTKIELGLGK